MDFCALPTVGAQQLRQLLRRDMTKAVARLAQQRCKSTCRGDHTKAPRHQGTKEAGVTAVAMVSWEGWVVVASALARCKG